MTVKQVFWWLPRPSASLYPGSFPLYFERKLLRLLGLKPDHARIIHVFGGKPEFGETVDINPENNPTYIGDAHNLYFLENNSYDLVIADPPYSQQESIDIYGVNRKLERETWVSEACRITKKEGYLALYHRLLLPRPENFQWMYIIAIAGRINHEGRLCGVFKKTRNAADLYKKPEQNLLDVIDKLKRE